MAQDGRIEPGDMILEVNGVSFEDMTNDEAVQTLRSAAQRPGSVSHHCCLLLFPLPYYLCYALYFFSTGELFWEFQIRSVPIYTV